MGRWTTRFCFSVGLSLNVKKSNMFTIKISTPYMNKWNFQDTGRLPGEPGDHLGYYQGPPIHTVTVFANPFLQD